MHPKIRFPSRLQDRFDQTYRIEFSSSREFWTIRVWDRGRPAAYLYAWHIRGKMLRIQDFKVADDLVVPEPLFLQLMRGLLKLRAPTISYRRRGIGTALLAAVIDYAYARGISRIGGDIVAHDQADFPGLPDWYHQRGFTLYRDDQGLHFQRDTTHQPHAAVSNL